MSASLATLVTLPQLAHMLGLHRSTVWRWLVRLRQTNRVSGRREWLVRLSKGERGMRINLQKLRRAHPELFDEPSPEELTNRLERVEGEVEQLKVRQNAHGSAIRDHAKKLRALG